MPPQAAILVRDSPEASEILVDALETVIKDPLGHAALNLVAKAAGMGEYILTGLEVYMYREPCLMCSMALSHSRIKRLFYLKKCGTDGSCGTRESIHTLPALNHRFQVFYGTLKLPCFKKINKTFFEGGFEERRGEKRKAEK